jgi:hypothetical protein
MGTLVRLYLAWRLVRLLRPLIAVALIASALLALHAGHAHIDDAAARQLHHAAAAAGHNLPAALGRAFEASPPQP